MKLLKYHEDLRSLFLLSIGLTSLFGATQVDFGQVHLLTYLFCVFWGTLNVFLICLLNHNHRHNPIFYSSYLNRIVNICISLCIGAPSTRLHLVHHFNHHRFFRTDEDWSSYKKHAKGKGLARLLYYAFSGSREIAKYRNTQKFPKKFAKELWIERIILLGFSFFILLLNFKSFIFLIAPSWFLGLNLLFISNLINHDQCKLNSEWNHSRNFLNPFENWFFMNNGYHSAHHDKPYIHWSLLPELHQQRFVKNMKSELNQGSFFVYLTKYVLFNYGK